MGSEYHDHVFEGKIPALMHSIDEDGRLIEVTDDWLSALGYERDEVIGKKSVEFLTVESRRYAESQALPQFSFGQSLNQKQNISQIHFSVMSP